jgi:multidrug efflux pump subunit AcrA (membrane-fusion protein)
MTANAEMVTAERQGVLLVPNRAIRANREAGTYTVNLYHDDGTVDQVEVSIGLRDSRYTEIKAGLEAGERLMIGEIDDGLDFMQGPPEGVRNMR